MQYKVGEYHIPWFIVGARSNIELANGVHVIPLDQLIREYFGVEDPKYGKKNILRDVLLYHSPFRVVRLGEKKHPLPKQILYEIRDHAYEIFLTLGLIEPEQEYEMPF